MDGVLKDKNHLGHYLNSIYMISEHIRYGKNKIASSLSVSGKQKTEYKVVYERTLENINGMQKQLHRLKEIENESKSLREKYDNLVLEKETDCGLLRKLYEDSEKKQENYKNKARDLMDENLVLKRNKEDLEAYIREIDYPNLNNLLQDALRKNEVYKNKSKDLLFSKQELEKRNHEQMQVLQEKNYLNAQLEELEKEIRELKKQLDQINEEKASLKDDYQQMLHHNNKNQDTIQKKNEEIAKLRNALVQNDKEKNQLSEISAKPVLRSLQTDGPVARKTHSNLLQSALEKRTCISGRKLQEELKNKDKEISELQKDEAYFKSTEFKEVSSFPEKKDNSYLKLKNELESSKNPELAENIRSIIQEIQERKRCHEELLKEIFILKETNANLIDERDVAIKEKINLLEEIETLKRELEAREIVYEEERNRYESTFRKEENDLRSRVSVLKRENGVLQREVENFLEEKHRLEELTHTGQNNLVEEIARLTQQLEERNVKLEVASVLIKDLNVSSKKQAQEFGQMLSVKEEENRKLDRQIQEMREILRSKEVGFINKMEMSKNEMSSLLSTAKEETKRISDDKTLGRQNLTDLKGYYENEILILKRNMGAPSREKEEITKERDALLSKQQKLGITHTLFDKRQSAVLNRKEERAMQQKIAILKHANQSCSKDFETMKEKTEILRQKNPDIKNVAEQGDVKIQLGSVNGVEHPILKSISSTITSIDFLEELAAKLKTDNLKQSRANLKKQITETYDKNVRSLDLAILKLINQLVDAKVRKENEEFERQLKLKHNEIQKLLSVFAFPDAIEKMRCDFEDAINKIIYETEKNIAQFEQFFSGDGVLKYQTVMTEIKAKYEEIIAMLFGELNRLQQIDNIALNDAIDAPKETKVEELK